MMSKSTITLFAAAVLALFPAFLCAQDTRTDSVDITSHRIGQWVITREYTCSSDDGYDDDEVCNQHSVSYDISSVHGFTPHIPLYSMGFNGFAGAPFSTLSSSVPLNEAKSWEWNVMLPLDGAPIGRSGHFGVGTALGFGRTTYKFADTRCFLTDPSSRTTLFEASGEQWKETWLRYWTFRLPVLLEYHTSSNGFFVSAGPELEYRFAASSRGRADGMKKSDIITRDLDFHPLGVNLLAQVGFRGLSVMARASLVELFAQSNPATEVYPVSIVIGIGFDD